MSRSKLGETLQEKKYFDVTRLVKSASQGALQLHDADSLISRLEYTNAALPDNVSIMGYDPRGKLAAWAMDFIPFRQYFEYREKI
jgi:hypothetical protein